MGAVSRNIKMVSDIKETSVMIRGMVQENLFININLFIWVNGKKENFMEKVPYFIL